MRTGRPATSTEQRRREGTMRSQHARLPLIIGGRMSKRPPCPGWLSADGKRAFRRILNDLWDSGVLDHADTLLIAIAADALGDAVESARDIKERGLVVDVTRVTRSGVEYTTCEKNPSQQIKSEALKRLHTACSELGIGPVARARLANAGVKGKSPSGLPGIGAKPTPLKAVKSA